ncbi:multiubiquitin domain-containing protein [Bradyrhizobium sp. 170]|uniref:multiubiquitin domain-containing protein n=1 Tax=Bradyrhizobium sp. 170 TaxID=2782641 RepID=UPI00200000C9|nr:multiubiquitin domain-containing protein [Bradyrhizobium sp. 170]UPK05755.1 multiubiquitin domain-containing protein [Bradyrhizobium sp. 170]
MTTERTDILEAEGLRHDHLVTVKVNERPLKLLGPRETGEQIKIAAIEQDVEIGKDYLLDEVLPDGTHRHIEDHEPVELRDQMVFVAHKPEHIVIITVNEQPVNLKGHSATGTEIKAAAIAQGVAIQPNFVLQEELPNGTSRIVGDNDVVHLREHLRFTAIAPDDNS